MPKMKDWRANSSTKTVGTLTGYYKKQNMKDNVTITEEQIDINTKSWCSFNIRAKNQTFFKTAQHKPCTRHKKTTQGNKAQGCRRQCILEMQAQTSDVLHSSLSSSELSLCKLSVFIDILMLFLWKWFCSLWFCVWLIFILKFVFDSFFVANLVRRIASNTLPNSSLNPHLFCGCLCIFLLFLFSSCIFHAADSRIFPDSH